MNWRSERGSVTPVWVFILGMVVLLGVAVVEREWANYKLKLLEQTLDFAAEAAGRTHEGWADAEVTMGQYYKVEDVCVEEDLDGTCIKQEPVIGYREHIESIADRRVADLRDNWRTIAGCGADFQEPNWGCLTATVTCQRVVFTTALDTVAEQTLSWNWRNQYTAFVDIANMHVVPQSSQDPCTPARRVDVSAEVQMRPLFGLVPWVHRTYKTGSSIVRLHPLVLE